MCRMWLDVPLITSATKKAWAATQTHTGTALKSFYKGRQRGMSPPACCSAELQQCFWWDNLCVVLQPMWGRDYIFIWGVFILPLPSVTSSVAMGHLQALYSGVMGREWVWERLALSESAWERQRERGSKEWEPVSYMTNKQTAVNHQCYHKNPKSPWHLLWGNNQWRVQSGVWRQDYRETFPMLSVVSP